MFDDHDACCEQIDNLQEEVVILHAYIDELRDDLDKCTCGKGNNDE